MAQSQESLTDQLRKLIALANANGLYDAADFVQRMLDDAERRKNQLAAMMGKDDAAAAAVAAAAAAIASDAKKKKDKKHLVDAIEIEMLRHDLSQSEVARRVGCNSSTVHTLLATRSASDAMLRKIAKALGIPVE